MIYISHRGNINGKIPEKENHPNYIKNAIEKGYEVEVDFWLVDNEFMLGHDKPQYKTDFTFLCNSLVWVHAKNYKAFEFIVNNNLKGFWHTNEDYVLTTWKYIWVFPGNPLIMNSIAVLPETVNYDINDIKKYCKGICSDNIQEYKNILS